MKFGKRKRVFLKGVIVESIGTPLSLLIGLFVVPYYFKFLTLEEFGYWLTLFEIISFFGLFYAGTDIFIIQTISKHNQENNLITKSRITNIFFLQIIIFCVITIILFILYFNLIYFGIDSSK